MARRSIRDRNSAAIAPELIEPVDVPAEQPPAVPTAAPAEVAPTAEASSKRQPATPKKKQASAPGDTDRLGIYLTPTEFDDARAAYLADWSNGERPTPSPAGSRLHSTTMQPVHRSSAPTVAVSEGAPRSAPAPPDRSTSPPSR